MGICSIAPSRWSGLFGMRRIPNRNTICVSWRGTAYSGVFPADFFSFWRNYRPYLVC